VTLKARRFPHPIRNMREWSRRARSFRSEIARNRTEGLGSVFSYPFCVVTERASPGLLGMSSEQADRTAAVKPHHQTRPRKGERTMTNRISPLLVVLGALILAGCESTNAPLGPSAVPEDSVAAAPRSAEGADAPTFVKPADTGAIVVDRGELDFSGIFGDVHLRAIGDSL
jgi:hypothetical protein